MEAEAFKFKRILINYGIEIWSRNDALIFQIYEITTLMRNLIFHGGGFKSNIDNITSYNR
jgi:hypothetical protein